MNIDNIEWAYLDEPTYNSIAEADVIAVGKRYSGIDEDGVFGVTYYYQLAGEVSSVNVAGTLVYGEE